MNAFLIILGVFTALMALWTWVIEPLIEFFVALGEQEAHVTRYTTSDDQRRAALDHLIRITDWQERRQ